MTRQRGFSLIELMISLTLASLLLTLLMQQFMVSKSQYLRLRTSLEQNLELQLIGDLIRDSVHKAGFTPCASINSLQSVDRRNSRTGLVAVEAQKGRDPILKINRMNEHFASVLKQLSPNRLLVKTDIQFQGQQSILVADCYHAEVQEILQARKSAAGTILTIKKNLHFNYIPPIFLGEWIEEQFFMQKNNQGLPALFYQQNHKDELSYLIQNLSVKLNFSQGRALVEVVLGLGQSQKLLIVSKVRGG